MSVCFAQTGTKEALAAALMAVKDDSNHLDSFKQAVIDDMMKLAPEFNGAHLDIVTQNNGTARIFTVNIIGKTLAI